MITMLDRDYSGKMGFNEFKELWAALNQWKVCVCVCGGGGGGGYVRACMCMCVGVSCVRGCVMHVCGWVGGRV